MAEALERPISGLTRRVLMPAWIAASVLAADQVAKWLVTNWLGPDERLHRHNVVGDILAVHYVENRGVAFGLFQGQAMLATVMAVLVLIFLVRTYRRADTASWRIVCGCGLIVGGAAGNLVDRVRLGYVVDFVAVSAWPKFNVADGAITIGALLLVWRYVRNEGREGLDERAVVTSGLLLVRHEGDR